MTCLVIEDELLCVKQARVFTDTILFHVVMDGHQDSRDGSYIFKKHTKRIFELDAIEVSLCSLLFSKDENTPVLMLT